MQLRFSLAASLLAALPGASAAAAAAPDERRGRRLGRDPSTSRAGPSKFAAPSQAERASVAKDIVGLDSHGFTTSLVMLKRDKKVAGQVAGQGLGVFGVSSPTNVRLKCLAAADAVGGEVQEVYAAMGGCALQIPDSSIMALSNLQMVESAQRNEKVEIPETHMQQDVDAKKKSAKKAAKDADKRAAAQKLNEGEFSSRGGGDDVSALTVLWGLDRVDQCSPDPDGASTREDAAGVRVYVLDTGVYGDHEAFGDNLGPLDCHHTSPSSGDHDSNVNPIDENGHGTHVAGTACSALYGVADCEVCSVRVLNANGSGSQATVISGLEFVLQQCAASETHPARRCVANMSLGAGSSPIPGTPYYQAVEDLEDAGVVLVVAAGNSNNDACHLNPAGHPNVLTVGSTQVDPSDQRSGFSSYGHCVEVYAPGSAILSAVIGSPTATVEYSGTSMASPHVAGLAAHAMSIKDDWAPTKESAVAIKESIVMNAHNTGASHPPGDPLSQIRIANSEGDCNGPTAPPTPGPPTPAPTPCSLGWDAELTLSLDDYPQETFWTLKDLCADDSPVIWGGNGYTDPMGVHVEEQCLAPGQYEFTMSDTYGDGFCCSYGAGSYVLMVAGVQEAEGGEFTAEDTTVWGSCDATAPPVSAPTTPPVSVPAPPTPPVDPPTDAPPAIVVGQSSVFTFVPRASCFEGEAGTETAAGTSAAQCAQACAVLLDCDGFEMFPDAAGVHEEGSCVLARSGDEHGPVDSCAHPVWFYERVEGA